MSSTFFTGNLPRHFAGTDDPEQCASSVLAGNFSAPSRPAARQAARSSVFGAGYLIPAVMNLARKARQYKRPLACARVRLYSARGPVSYGSLRGTVQRVRPLVSAAIGVRAEWAPALPISLTHNSRMGPRTLGRSVAGRPVRCPPRGTGIETAISRGKTGRQQLAKSVVAGQLPVALRADGGRRTYDAGATVSAIRQSQLSRCCYGPRTAGLMVFQIPPFV